MSFNPIPSLWYAPQERAVNTTVEQMYFVAMYAIEADEVLQHAWASFEPIRKYTFDPPVTLQPGRYILRIENSIPCFIPIQEPE